MKNLIPECIIGVLVVVIGITVVVKIIRFCQRHFPDPIPDPPQIVQSNTFSAALFVLGPAESSQASPHTLAGDVLTASEPCDDCGCALELSFEVKDGQPVITSCGLPRMVTETEFRAGLAALNVPAGNAPSLSYAHGVVTIDGGGQVVVIERSDDLRAWIPVLTNDVPLGRVVQATVNGGCNAAFFRVRF